MFDLKKRLIYGTPAEYGLILPGLPRSCHFDIRTPYVLHSVVAEEDALKKKNEQRSTPSNVISDFPHKKRNMLIAGVVAVTAMVGYALMSGLIEVGCSVVPFSALVSSV